MLWDLQSNSASGKAARGATDRTCRIEETLKLTNKRLGVESGAFLVYGTSMVAQHAAVDDIENPPAMRPFASVATFEAQRRLYDLYTMRDIYEAVILLLVFVIAAADPRISLPWYVKAQVDHFQHECNCTLVGTFPIPSNGDLSELPCNGHNYYRQSDQNVFTNFSCQTAARCAVDFTQW